jgi:hypothetical protein
MRGVFIHAACSCRFGQPGVHRAGKGTLDQGCLLDLVGVDGLKRPVLLALAHGNEESSENCVAFFEFIKSVRDPVPMVA